MTTNPYPAPCFIHEDVERELPPTSRSDVKPQYVHHLTPNPPPEISHSVPKQKDGKQRCVKFTVAAVISLLLLLLVTGILLAYYFSSSCVHGSQCGDGSCVWESQWCDGVRDCPAGQDEANCVRLHGSGFLLQIYSPQTKTWSSVCSHGWSDMQGRAGCRAIGYSRGTDLISGQQKTDSDDGFLIVKPDFNPEVFVVQQLEHSNNCPNNSVVTLRCTDCGSGVNSSRASGGQQATLGSWPWQVSLQVSGSHRCGGAIISPYWIVTAAHCVSRSSSPADWAVYAGVVDPLGSLFNPARSVSRIIAHEGYSRLPRRNDVALMRLTKALDFSVSSNIRPICLPNVGLNVSAPQRAWITRFGRTTDGDSPQLMEAQVSLIDTAECNSSALYSGRLSQDMLCAREMDGGADMCHTMKVKLEAAENYSINLREYSKDTEWLLGEDETDSGGPLVARRDGLWWLIGDNIWGEHCTERNKPGVYGNITYFLDWIYRQMKEHQDD